MESEKLLQIPLPHQQDELVPLSPKLDIGKSKTVITPSSESTLISKSASPCKSTASNSGL